MTGLIHQTTKLVIFCILGIGAATSTLAAPPTPISACPYTISTPGSYAVTQNLSVSSIGGNCTSLVPPLAGVSIDLQNHSITGSGPNNTGAGAGISCFLTSSGAKCDNVIIVNGTISKFPSAGISIAGDGNIVSGVTATANGGFGVVLGARVGNRTDRERDTPKRLSLVHQAEAIMEQNPPLLPVAWERINEIWYNHVRVSTQPHISASSTSCVWIRSGSTRREPRLV